MSKPDSGSIFRVVQGVIRLTNSAGDAIAGIIGDRLKVDAGLSRNHKSTIMDNLNTGVKYSLALEDAVHALKFQTVPNTAMCFIEYAFDETDFDNGDRITIEEGDSFDRENLLFESKTLYFSVSRSSVKLQIEQWY